MLAFRRSRAFLPLVLVLVGVVIGFLVMQASGSDDKDNGAVATVDRTTNCSPVARADAAATRPGETVLVDVLANDTDADGDQLVFQILKTEGGTSEIDDGDTPTDSGDDRLAFTPVDPPTETATVEYQSLDPQGGFSTTTLTVAVNPDALLPDGVRSALASDPSAEGAEGGRCGDTVDTTSTTSDVGPVGPETEGVDTTTTTVEEVDEVTDTTSRRRTGTTRRSTSPNRTTTTKKPSGSTNTTARPPSGGGGGPGTTDAPSVPAPGDGGGPGTTSPATTSPPPPPDPDCGTPNTAADGSPQTPDQYRECLRNKST